MRSTHAPHAPQQAALPLEVDEALVLAKARELFCSSRYLSGKYASFERVMEQPVTARCLRMGALALLRSGAKRTRGR